jgi:hypothetical protein
MGSVPDGARVGSAGGTPPPGTGRKLRRGGPARGAPIPPTVVKVNRPEGKLGAVIGILNKKAGVPVWLWPNLASLTEGVIRTMRTGKLRGV